MARVVGEVFTLGWNPSSASVRFAQASFNFRISMDLGSLFNIKMHKDRCHDKIKMIFFHDNLSKNSR